MLRRVVIVRVVTGVMAARAVAVAMAAMVVVAVVAMDSVMVSVTSPDNVRRKVSKPQHQRKKMRRRNVKDAMNRVRHVSRESHVRHVMQVPLQLHRALQRALEQRVAGVGRENRQPDHTNDLPGIDLRRHAMCGHAELAIAIGELVNRTGIGARELNGTCDNRREHFLQVERRIHSLRHLAKRSQLTQPESPLS